MDQMIRRVPTPPGYPPFSLAVSFGGVLHVSGAGPVEPDGSIARGDFAAQFQAVIRNLKAALAAGGSDIRRVLKTTVLLTRASDVAEMNRLYAEAFAADALPARTTAVVVALPVPEFLIEIECLAAITPAQPEGSAGT